MTKLMCPTCGTGYGEQGCPHSPAGAPPPSGFRAAGAAPAGMPAAAGTGSGFVHGVRGASAAGAAVAEPAKEQKGIYVGAQVVPQGDFKITSLGYERCGKTTYLGMLYFLLTTGRLPGYRFAWSDSLRDLEQIRAQLHRPAAAGGPTFPPRTDTDKTLFMHLGLRRWDDDAYVDLFFPEFSGEDVGRVWTDGHFPRNLHFLQYFDGYMLFLDATATGALDVGKYLRMVTGLIELKGGLRLKEPVAILLSKWDLVADQEDKLTPEQFFRERFGGLHDAWRGQLENFRVFAVSAVGKVRTLLGHDGLPIKRDGAVLHVPAPERLTGEGNDDPSTAEPTFAYRPLNLSRPLLWLLDELARQKKKALPAGSGA